MSTPRLYQRGGLTIALTRCDAWQVSDKRSVIKSGLSLLGAEAVARELRPKDLQVLIS